MPVPFTNYSTEAEEEYVAERLYGMSIEQAITSLNRAGEDGKTHAKAIELAMYWLIKETVDQHRAAPAHRDTELMRIAYEQP